MQDAGLMSGGDKPFITIRGSLKTAAESGNYPEITASANRIRDLRENEKTKIKRSYDKRVSTMARESPIAFASGFVPNFAKAKATPKQKKKQ